MPDPVQKVAFVLTGHAERQPGTPFGSEFGAPSTVDFPSTEPLVLLLLREQGAVEGAAPRRRNTPVVHLVNPGRRLRSADLNGLLLRATER